MGTYLDDLIDRLEAAHDRTVLRHDDASTSGRDLLAGIRRTARALEELGIGRGDLVALYAPNRPDALAVRYATHLLGAGSVFLSAPPDPEKRAQMLVDFAPRLVVVWPETAHLLPHTTAPVGSVGAVDGIDLRLDELAAAQPATALASRARPEDLAVIVSSGGTTGVPKGSVRDFATWTRAVAKPSPADRRQLANGKLAYLTQILVDSTLLGGGTVVLQDGYDAVATLAAIETERITDLFLVEPQLFDLMDHPDLERYDLSSLRALNHIGAYAAPVLRRRARERLGPVIGHTYGASEIGIVSALRPAENTPENMDTTGRILPSVEVRFRSMDTTLHPTFGGIEVRSPDMAAGYRHRPHEQVVNFVDGWYRTGDLGHLDSDGYLHVHGRAIDCSDVNDHLVTPSALQDILCRIPEVRYAVIVRDPVTGIRVAAVIAWPGSTVDETACLTEIRSVYGDLVTSQVQILPVSRIPLTEQGKPDRPMIRRLAGRTRDHDGVHDQATAKGMDGMVPGL